MRSLVCIDGGVLMMGCEFWTADKRLVNAVRDKLPWVRWLGD